MRFRVWSATALIVLLAGYGSAPRAQQRQPVYPAYDGFLKNADGSYTLSFAYFSHNADVVTIAPGPANAFVPAPGDRMQPTTFLPGHWRFQCVMVVGPEFDGKMKWTLGYAGTTTGTSERMLQSNWNLVEGAAALGKIDYATVPKGVCLNRPPTVRILGLTQRRDGPPPTLSVAADEELNLFGSVHDEGLPRGKSLVATWAVLSGPGKVTFTIPGAARTKAIFGAPGTYELALTGSDSEFTETARVTVKVEGQAPVPVQFARDIQPIFERSCWTCHGARMQLSKLDLRTRDAALRGGTRGPALVPGRAERSPIYRTVAHLDAIKMPMQGDQLAPAEIAIVKAWIDQGARWEAPAATATADGPAPPAVSAALSALEEMALTPEQRSYWAFVRPVKAPLPVVAGTGFTNPIDRFLEQERAARSLTAAPRADRSTLVRRAYLDLLGLPPTPAQVDAFVSDDSPQAWERLVDTLLASPHYGERYGRHWLDVARYADSAGFEYDTHRPNAWRYRDYVIKAFNEDMPYNRFVTEQLAGDEVDDRSDETRTATGFLRAGPRVLFREKDNPERRFDYLDEILGTIGKGMLGLTVNCARCHNHKFDPIAQKDYYALQASIFGYVETEVPMAPRAEAETYLAKTAEIDAALQTLRDEVAGIERPHRERLELDQIRTRFPEHIVQAATKPEVERTPGERLLATQVYEAVNVPAAEIDRALSPAEADRKKQLVDRMAEVEQQRPPQLPMIEIATDGDHRFSPLGEGDNIVSCPKCRIPPPFPGSYIHKDGAYEVPPSYFLIRGDVESRGSLMKPGFISVATVGTPPTEIPRPDGNTSGRRLALARWIGSGDNPLTARVIVNRLWQKHFGRGIVSTLENFGKMGEQPTHQALLDWLAVEFVDRGWSIKQINKVMVMSDAYQMASRFDHPGNRTIDPDVRYLWRYRPQRLEAEAVRDSLLVAGGNINLAVGGEPIFPFIPPDVLAGQYRGKWKNTPDGPEAWRRSVYVYRRRSLPYPMFDTFDHPDMNVTAGARNVSTVPTQALTLLNNPFVIDQAGRFAERVRQGADAPRAQVNLAYRIALGRPATEAETAIGVDLIERQSLDSFAHVVLNLDEFLYVR